MPPLVETGNTATVCDGTCCMLIGSAGDEEAEADDYQLIDAAGMQIADTVHFAFGEMTKQLTVKAVKDALNEYPETLNLAIAASGDGATHSPTHKMAHPSNSSICRITRTT